MPEFAQPTQAPLRQRADNQSARMPLLRTPATHALKQLSNILNSHTEPVIQGYFRETGPQQFTDAATGEVFHQSQAQVDNRLQITNGAEAFYITLVRGNWYRDGEPRTAPTPPVRNAPQVIREEPADPFYVGAKGATLRRSESFDSTDSQGATYRVHGSKVHKELAARGKAAKRTSTTQNVVTAALSIHFVNAANRLVSKTAHFTSAWNSGYFQHLLHPEDPSIKPESFEAGQRAVTARVLPGASFSAQSHAHSEVSMDADPTIVAQILAAYTKLLGKVPEDSKILKAVIRVHSSPNTVCMNACRFALEEVRKAAELSIPGAHPPTVQTSGRFAVELMATSDKPFRKLAGNPQHKALAEGREKDLTPAPPRGASGRLIEVLNDRDQGKSSTEDHSNSSSSSSEAGDYDVPQLMSLASSGSGVVQTASAANKTGLPDSLKSGIESLSGMSMDRVKVHYNSSRPAELNAHAYAQGTDIHVGPGQEKHLPHEAWHIVQQAQGRVKPTKQLLGRHAINDDRGLEAEATQMGAHALQQRAVAQLAPYAATLNSAIIQRAAGVEYETSIAARFPYTAANPEEGRVPQDETMLTAAGWKIDSDNSKLEFVTEPPVDVAALAPIVDNMLDAVARFPTTLAVPTLLSDIVLMPAAKAYVIPPYAKEIITGSPQGTVGIPFDRLFHFFELLTRYRMDSGRIVVEEHDALLTAAWDRWRAKVPADDEEAAAKGRREGVLRGFDEKLQSERDSGQHPIGARHAAQFADISAAVNASVAGVAGLAAPQLNKLKGLLHFIGQYILNSQGAHASYKKMLFPVMARSSFASMYSALHRDAKTAFPAAAAELVTRLGATAATTLLPGQAGGDFTVQQWLDSIVVPEPREVPGRPGGLNRIVNSDRMTAPGATAPRGSNTDKSMGALKVKGGLVVVELRALKSFTRISTFTVPSMRAFVADLANLIAGGGA